MSVRIVETRLLISVLVLVVCFTVGGCGKKGNPVFKSVVYPEPISDLAAAGDNGRVALSWTLPGGSDVASFRILRSEIEIGSEQCPTCPPVYDLSAEMDIGDSRLVMGANESFRYMDVRVRRGYSYAYKVVTCFSSNFCGEDSNIAVIDMN